MKIRRGNREYVLTEDELYRAHKEFVAGFMIDRLEVDFGVPKAYAIEYGKRHMIVILTEMERPNMSVSSGLLKNTKRSTERWYEDESTWICVGTGI